MKEERKESEEGLYMKDGRKEGRKKTRNAGRTEGREGGRKFSLF
jgi:hypothetical protein